MEEHGDMRRHGERHDGPRSSPGHTRHDYTVQYTHPASRGPRALPSKWSEWSEDARTPTTTTITTITFAHTMTTIDHHVHHVHLVHLDQPCNPCMPLVPFSSNLNLFTSLSTLHTV